MAAVTLVDDSAEHTWESTRVRLLEIQQGGPDDDVLMAIDEDTWFAIYFVPGLGYYMAGCGVGDRDYYNLVDSRLGDDVVEAFFAGNTSLYPRYAFVNADRLLKAAEAFYKEGKRDTDCEWVLDEDAIYE